MDKNPADLIRELAVESHPMQFTTSELVILSTALEGLGAEITRRMSGASAEAVQGYARMLADAKTLENRLDTLIHSLIADLGEKLAEGTDEE